MAILVGVAIGGTILAVISWQVLAQTASSQSTGSRPAGSGSTVGGSSATACDISGASVSATSTAPDGIDGAGQTISYSASNMVDGDPGTAWRTPGRGIGDLITVEFPEPCHLSAIRVLNGYHKIDPIDGTDRWNQNRRVKRVEIELSSRTTTASMDANSRNWQTINAEAPAVDRVTLRILGSAPSKPARDFTAISEIQVS